MKIAMYQVDAFSSRVFRGNPAAVCVLGEWLPDPVMQAIALENNLSETAFVIPGQGGPCRLRWFTPELEMDLAGHPTLATAHVIFEILRPGLCEVEFDSPGGRLTVRKGPDGLLAMDFPSRPGLPVDDAAEILAALGVESKEVYKSRDHMVVLPGQAEVLAVRPDAAALRRLCKDGVIVTAPGEGVDFVSRFFAPDLGILEDPVTGSAHCTLIPYWAARLGKSELHALQVSARGGELFCRDMGRRVSIAGRAVLYLEGHIWV